MLAVRVTPEWWLILFGVFLIFEVHGAIDGRPGDTLSETIWRLEKRGWARRIFGVALGCAFGVRFYSLPAMIAGEMDPLFLVIPWTLLSIGLAGWLAVHFAEFGRDG